MFYKFIREINSYETYFYVNSDSMGPDMLSVHVFKDYLLVHAMNFKINMLDPIPSMKRSIEKISNKKEREGIKNIFDEDIIKKIIEDVAEFEMLEDGL